MKLDTLNGWKRYKLSDVITYLGGNAFKSTDSQDNGVRWLKIANVGFGEIDWSNLDFLPNEVSEEYSKYLLKEHDIVMALTRPILNEKLKIAKVKKGDTPALLNQRVAKLTANDGFYLEFLYYVLSMRSTVMKIENAIAGTDPPNLGFNDLKSVNVFVPINIGEQQKIAAILSTWDKAIELKEKLIEQKKEQKKGLMQKLLTGEVRLPGFYEKWEKRQIGELITESKVIADEPDLNKRITVRLNLKGVQKREVTSVEKENVTTQYVRRAGQFIYGKQNLYKGAIGIVPEELDGFQSSSDIPSFDFNSDVDGLWFYYYFSRESFYSYLEVISTGTGSKRVNPKDLFRIKINVPPLDEQRQISKILLSQDQEIKLLEKELKALKMQKKGLMQLLLTGKIRVKV